jgi:hypothetical protein
MILLAGLGFSITQAQEFKTPVSEFPVADQAKVIIDASYTEIEIEEWNKNRIEVHGVMQVEGLSASEAKNIFDSWEIETAKRGNTVEITANSDSFGNEFFFIHNDKYLGNVVVDIPEISAHVLEALDSIHVVLPEISDFPDIEYNFDFSTNLDYESLSFDYDEFKNNSEYLKQWQERNKEQLERLKKELKESHLEMAEKYKETEKQIIVIQEEARARAEREIEMQAKEIERQVKQAEKQAQIAEKEAREVEKEVMKRQSEIQKILEERQKIKVKRILKVKMPKNAKLEMDVDYCKITTVN